MTQEFKLQPCDTLVTINDRRDPLSTVKRWLIGPYSHVYLYLGRVYITNYMAKPLPFLFESNGRGVSLRLLSERYGERVVVMRAKYNWVEAKLPQVISEAIKLASKANSYYDYMCIVKYILPRLICEKLGLPMPLSWHRDEFQICSEAVNEVYHRANIDLLPQDVVPLPGDFITDTPILEQVHQGELSPRWVD